VDFATIAAHVPLRGARVVDVGCGTGELVRSLAAAGADAVGVEISTARLATAIDRDPDRVARYAVGVAEDLPFDDAAADLVIFMKSLHHVPAAQIPAALREAARIARAGGAVYVAEPLLTGTFYPLTRLVDDETVVRGLAQHAVASCGLAVEATAEYDTRPSFADFDAFRRLLVGVDPARAATMDAADAELRAAFADHAQIDDASGHHVFVQPMRVQVLRVA
jgi:hypothetical protein